jgi:hypothetical protein
MIVEDHAESFVPQGVTITVSIHEFAQENRTSNLDRIRNGSDSLNRTCNSEKRHRLQVKRAVDRICKLTRPHSTEPLTFDLTCHCKAGEEQGLWGSRGYAREWYQHIRPTTALTKQVFHSRITGPRSEHHVDGTLRYACISCAGGACPTCFSKVCRFKRCAA